jgi:hypothetical protein
MSVNTTKNMWIVGETIRAADIIAERVTVICGVIVIWKN